MKIAFTFIAIFLTCFILDMIWLGFIAADYYKSAIGGLMRRSGETPAPHWPAAMIVYLAITVGIMVFVLNKADGHYLQALLWGALFGAVTYGIYDFTNYAVLDKWPFYITLVDFGWGSFLCGLSALVGMTVSRAFGGA